QDWKEMVELFILYNSFIQTHKVIQSIEVNCAIFMVMLDHYLKKKMTTKSLLLSLFFERLLIRKVKFLDEIALKSNNEKDGFYKRLAKTLGRFRQSGARHPYQPVENFTHCLDINIISKDISIVLLMYFMA
ncbi:hypothetical protein RFI_33134, partial [Reticulomyxa filosa]